jgi:hypothetical protein
MRNIKVIVAGTALVGAAGLGIGACGSSGQPTHAPPAGSENAPPPPTLTSVQKTDFPSDGNYGSGDTMIYVNHWSDGTTTTCTIHTFDTGQQPAPGPNCIPEDTP